MTVKDWPGVANGNAFTVADKRSRRVGADLPEDVEREMRALLEMPVVTSWSDLWRGGLVDLQALDGMTQASMTREQGALWRKARDEPKF